MISNELLDEIIDISSKGKYIDKKILQRVFEEIFVDVDDYTKKNFNKLEFVNIDRKTETLGICYADEGIIQIDLIENYIYENRQKNINMFIKNLKIINKLFHELEHLKQPYKITKNNFESELLKSSIIYDEKLYDDLYNCIPSEKIAFANSWKLLLNNLLNYPSFDSKYFDEYKFVNNEYIRNLKLGYIFDEFYEEYNVPLFTYLKKTEQLDVLKKVGSWRTASSSKKINNISIEKK